MYSLPELHGMEDRLCMVSIEEVQECETECVHKGEYPCDKDLFEACCVIMEENDWTSPEDGNEAAQLYTNLRNNVRADLQMA